MVLHAKIIVYIQFSGKICTGSSMAHVAMLASLTRWLCVSSSLKRLHGHVSLHVEREVVGPREGPLTEPALERTVAGVFAVVTGQLIRACKLPSTALPAALIRFLPRVRAEMRLEVRGLGVCLAARWMGTRVYNHFSSTPVATTAWFIRGDGGLISGSRRWRWRYGIPGVWMRMGMLVLTEERSCSVL